MARYDIVGQKECECGCGGIIQLKGWHFEKYGVIPRFILGHNPITRFKNGNKANWKGGEIKCNGYILVYQPNHPQANAMGKGYVRRVRLKMEEQLGRYLEDRELVHHINGIKDDDRLENLVILTRSKHSSIHSKETTKGRERNSIGQFIKVDDANEISA